MSGPPIKPPRGVKQQRETSGLLMSVIRTLSASESNEQRDREKAKLEKEYKRSDKKLEELVSDHDQDLTQVMHLFEKLSSRVITSRDKIHSVKENLIACKMLLRCKREELKKLWLEGIEHKHVLYLLEEIDKLREVPAQLNTHLSKKHYLHATKLLVTSLETAEGTLDGVEALRDVRLELQSKRDQLQATLMSELGHQLYNQPSTQAAALRRQGSGVRGSGRTKPIRKGLDIGQSSQNATNKGLLHPDEAHSSLTEDLNIDQPDQQPEYFVAILIESLAMLGKLPDAVEHLKSSMQPEMLTIVSQTSSHITSTNMTQDNSSLLELLLTLFDQFRAVAAVHAVALKCLRQAAEKYRIKVRLYEIADVWAKLQAVLQQVLTNYLDIPNTSGSTRQAPASFTDTATSDLSTYFARRKPQKPKRTPLFKFDSSSHALSITSYMKEQEEGGNSALNPQGKNLVCTADPWNITTIFIPLSKFVDEIEQTTGMHAVRNPCALRTFIADFVQDVFLGRQHVKLASSIENATRTPDAWRATISNDLTHELGLSRPLLQSIYSVEQCVTELRQLMTAMPSYAEHFLAMACNMLRSYRETCQAAYRGIVQPDAEDKRVFSAAWLKDDDISRFLKSLPNWTDLQTQRTAQRQLGRYTSAEEESPEDVRQRNLREAEILAGNLGEGAINAHEILSDVSQLRGLAQLQESTEWFSSCLTSFASTLPRLSPNETSTQKSNDEIPPLPAATVDALAQLAHEFEDLANTCLLVLHLEVRVQCFHYLLPRGTAGHTANGTTSDDLDPRVLQLSRAVTSIDEALSSALQPNKAKYVFEGLGHLIAKILITSAQYTNHIDEVDIQKICRNILSLQQTLASVTMVREAGLDHARHYFELFYLTPEELLGTVMEKGAQFSELEYMNALQLLHRSRGDSGSVTIHLQRLSDILGEVGVTV